LLECLALSSGFVGKVPFKWDYYY